MTYNVDKAVKFIKSRKLVVFPTETVYGLGANAENESACLKIFQIKKRPTINPLIVHVASLQQAESIGEFNDDARKLANRLWPGPLSIIVPLKNFTNITPIILAGLKTIALRIPAHKVALELIKNSNVPIAAPSANPSGYISSTHLDHVREHFGDKKDIFILETDLNKSQYGLESTIIDSTSTIPSILRDGYITLETLEAILEKKINKVQPLTQIKAPGMLAKHYAPQIPVRLNAKDLKPNEIGINFANSKLDNDLPFKLNLSVEGDLIEAASNLYFMLRKAENYAILNALIRIAIAPIPEINIGIAINDRLKRASY